MRGWQRSPAWPCSRSCSSARWASPENRPDRRSDPGYNHVAFIPQEAHKMTVSAAPRSPVDIEHAVVRFAGDSGDGMQLTAPESPGEAALHGNALAPFPDYPAEIRAPAGTPA